MRIRVVSDRIGAVEIELFKTHTARAIWGALPIRSTARRWGDEVYFPTPIKLDLEDGVESVNIGDVAYWPPEQCICIFFGPTPMSRGKEIRAYSKVNVFGRVAGDARVFDRVEEGDRILVEPLL